MVPRFRRSLFALSMVPVLGGWLAVTAVQAAAVDASTAPIDIDFEQDAPGRYDPGFTSADSSLLSFDRVDYAGTGDCAPPTTCGPVAEVDVFDVRGAGDSNALTTSGIGVSWAIRIRFAPTHAAGQPADRRRRPAAEPWPDPAPSRADRLLRRRPGRERLRAG